MNDDTDPTPAGGPVLHRGPDHAAPYPVSRLAPPSRLVDLAQEIARADEMVAGRVTAQLRVIAEQVKHLQAQARQLLEEARRDQELHHARCSFQRVPGRIYHLYRDAAGRLEFSMLSPAEWGGAPPRAFVGSYRLEADRSWTPLEQLGRRDDSAATIDRLLQGPPGS